MWEPLVSQLKEVREIARGTVELHHSVGEQLNELLCYMKSIEDSRIRTQVQFVSPLKLPSNFFRSEAAAVFCSRLIAILDSDEKPPPAYKSDIKRLIPLTNNVFIIHGHDHVNMMRLKSLLKERFQTSPIVLSERPDQGRSLIEKFENEAEHTAYAFAIITPDDEVKKGDTIVRQARPNVTFEIGWFYGRLGRERVCILLKRGSSVHSDLSGIMRIEFIESVEEKIGEIETELNSAGLIKR